MLSNLTISHVDLLLIIGVFVLLVTTIYYSIKVKKQKVTITNFEDILDDHIDILDDHIDIIEQKNEESENHELTTELLTEHLTEVHYSITEINLMKDKLISIIAHDIKGPLSLLCTSLEFINSPVKIEESLKNELLSNAHKGVVELLAFLDRLLDWSRSIGGNMVYTPTGNNLSEIIFNISHLFSQQAESKGIKLTIDCPSNLMVMCENNMISTVIRNIVNNAIKFTNKGDTITIWAKELSDREVQVGISDTGIGMTSETIENVLEPHNTYSTPGTSGEKGSGFGISVTKEFIEKHNSTLVVESIVGEGTTFSFSLEKLDDEDAQNLTDEKKNDDPLFGF